MIHVWAHLQLESEMVHSHRHMALVIHGRRTLGAATFTLYRGGISTVENKRRNFFLPAFTGRNFGAHVEVR